MSKGAVLFLGFFLGFVACYSWLWPKTLHYAEAAHKARLDHLQTINEQRFWMQDLQRSIPK